MGNKKRVVKFRKRKTINVGVIVFLILFVYILINVYLYFTKEHMSIYEVQEGSTIENNHFTGLILRDEKIFYTDKPGYVMFFHEDGARIAKNSSVYSIDDSQQILDMITSSEEPFTSTKENNAKFQYVIKKFQSSYSDSNFEPVYSFKDRAQNMVMDLLNQAMIEKGQKIQSETGIAYTYGVVGSTRTGMITYSMDSYEDITEDSISPELFETDNYERVSLRTLQMVTSGTPVYKLISSEKWSIVLPIDKKLYDKLEEKTRIALTILKDNFDTTANISLFTRGTNYYAKLTMDKYLSNYISDRHLEILLHLDSTKGLKIPVTSLVNKDFYLVPLEYFTTGADSGKTGIVKESYDTETGEVLYTFVPTDIYHQDDLYGYIDTRLFSEGVRIKSPTGTDSYQLYQTGKLIGVFNVNTGYAVFKRVEILYQDDSYCILKKNTSNGLSVYDHIALNSATAVEQTIIY